MPLILLWRRSLWRANCRRRPNVSDQRFADAAEAEETYHNAIKRALEKTEALEKTR